MDTLRQMGVTAMGIRHNGVYTQKAKGKVKPKKTKAQRLEAQALVKTRYENNAKRIKLGKVQGFALHSSK